MYRAEWLKYTNDQKKTLAEHYDMKKTGMIEVFNGQLVADGYIDKDIFAIEKAEADKLLGLIKDVKDEKSTKKATNKKGAKGTNGTKSTATKTS